MLNQAMSLAQMLSFTSGNPLIIGGVAVASTLVEVLEDAFGSGGDDSLTTEIQAMGTAISQHMSDLFAELQLQMSNTKLSDAMDVVNGVSREQAMQTNSINQTTAANNELIPPSALADMNASANAIKGGDSPLSLVMQFAQDNGVASSNYATLPLSLSAALVYMNYLKYCSMVNYTFANRSYLDAPSPKPPVPSLLSDNPGTLQGTYNSNIYDTLSQVVQWATPLVQGLNKAVQVRQLAADAAAASVSVTNNGWCSTISPTIASSGPAAASQYTDPQTGESFNTFVGSTQANYGSLTDRNANTIASLTAGQKRRTAWVQSTAIYHLPLYKIADITLMNHTLWTINQAYQQYCQMLGKPIPPDLTGIYLPPPESAPIPRI